MFSFQIVIMFTLCSLCFCKASFWGAFTLYISYCVYWAFVIPVSDNYYYPCAALLTLIVGLILQQGYKVAAICSYCLVLVNTAGYIIFELGYKHDIYDNICSIILLIQLSSLLPKGLLNGLRRNNQHPTTKFSFFNGD